MLHSKIGLWSLTRESLGLQYCMTLSSRRLKNLQPPNHRCLIKTRIRRCWHCTAQPCSNCLTFLQLHSQGVWKKLSQALQAGEMRAANKEKSAVESNQRRVRQEQAAKGLLWEPRFFRCQMCFVQPKIFYNCRF